MIKRKKFYTGFNIIIRSIVSLLPRDKHLIVYGGSWDLIIDNAKHQFFMNNETMPNYRHIWLTRKCELLNYMRQHGFESEKSNGLRGVLYLLRAGFVVYDDGINYFSQHILSVGAVRINLWHGVPAKMIGRSNKDEDYVPYKSYGKWHKIRYSHLFGDYCLSPSKNLVRFFSYSFQIPPERIIIGGYPRTCSFFMSEEERVSYIKKYENEEYLLLYNEIRAIKERKVIYMPTFRDKNKFYLNQAIPDWNRLNSTCKQAGVILYIKVHRVTPLPDFFSYSHIRIMNNRMDIYSLLPLFDMLITDYSSIMYDFSLLKKKVVLYTYDIMEYRTQSRPLYDYFDKLLKDLSTIDTFEGFLRMMSINLDEVKEFPTNRFFDAPNDYMGVQKLIQSLS